jgi:hypothetical protein
MDEESWRRGGDSQPTPRGESSFDELAKNLADGSISRRKALRFIGGAFVGGLLASIPGTAWAAKPPPPSKGGCPPGRTQCRGKCVDLQTDRNNCGRCSNVCSDQESCWGGTCCSSSRGEQFCEAGVGTRICCPPNTYCAGPRLCCQFNQINCNGQCVSTDCQEGQFFDFASCQCVPIGQCTEGGTCGTGFPQCGPNCYCGSTVEGGSFCFANVSCGGVQTCVTSADCPTDYACVPSTCCGSGALCAPPCTGAGVMAAPAGVPTVAGR